MNKTLLAIVFIFIGVMLVAAREAPPSLVKPNNVYELGEYLRAHCNEQCIDKLKSEVVCSKFCEFIDDINEEHSKEVWNIYNKGHKQLDVALWSLSDLIDYRLKSHEEDPHILAEEFLSRYTYWIDYIEKKALEEKDEL
jgi:hypothetical protein